MNELDKTALDKIAPAVLAFQKEYQQVKFDATVKVSLKSGGSYTFEYATLSHIIETLRPVYTKHGLALFQVMNGPNLITTLIHDSGQSISSSIPLNLQGTNQEQGAEISYKRRYQVACILGVVADEDDDSNATSSESFEKSLSAKSREPKGLKDPPKFSESMVALEKSLNSIKTIEDLLDWAAAYKSNIDGLPENEKNILRKLYKVVEGTLKGVKHG